ncbi:hypothetical protein FE257_012868 [Aspergillus nanangensis]|uniref:WD40 domain protein n=1 Tax=Aspergillus nanangensis TaxID=2582783 RepID=A0AAD4CFK2_ASPNN|nr:hypothetical protein FE257_012868 [Aspergillus nanangensis]
MDSIAAGPVAPITLSDDGVYVAQVNNKDLIVHLNPTSSEFRDVHVVKVKENAPKFLKFSRALHLSPGEIQNEQVSVPRRLLYASDTRIQVWQLNPLQSLAEIEGIEPGALNIDFGGDENEIIVFHAWNTKITIYGLDTGRSQVIKAPKFAHGNGFGYRPKTREFAVLLKPDANDLLTLHNFRTYELINRAVLPTVDAQGLKWSPDGRWIVIWDAASAGTKVLIFTADGQLFRTYTGIPGTDASLDLGVRGLEWSPPSPANGASEFLAIGKVDGSVEILTCKTNSPRIWRERLVAADGNLEYADSSSSSAFNTIPEPSNPPRGVSTIAFSADAQLIATIDQTRPNIVWIWELEPVAVLMSALVHEHAVRQALWHPSKIQLVVTTVNNTGAAVRSWSPYTQPSITRVPVPRNETGRYDLRWISLDRDDKQRFWLGSHDDYILGFLDQEDGGLQFQSLHHINNKVPAGSYGANTSR